MPGACCGTAAKETAGTVATLSATSATRNRRTLRIVGRAMPQVRAKRRPGSNADRAVPALRANNDRLPMSEGMTTLAKSQSAEAATPELPLTEYVSGCPLFIGKDG
jgi:hypothetical protein